MEDVEGKTFLETDLRMHSEVIVRLQILLDNIINVNFFSCTNNALK